MTKNPIKFGTDGWRGVIAEDFTFDNVRICAQGAASYLKEAGLDSRGIVIGYDYRFASEDFAAAAAEVIAGNGIKVYLCSRVAPTPVVCFGIISKKAGGGIIITASHNPARYNGFKFRDENGASAPTGVITKLERHVSETADREQIKRTPLAEALEQGLVEYLDLTPGYLKRAAEFVDLNEMRRAKLKVVVDPMYGAGIGYFKTLLGGGNIEVVEINGERNPAFPGIQPEPIAANLTRLSAMVREQKADVGIASDGDADRIGIMDENGEFLTQLQVFALLSLYLLEIRGERGPLVRTITSTSMINRLGEIYEVPVYETPVGFKYVAPVMLAENALIGGEESGGYGFRGHVPERDAVPAGLYFLDFMIKTGKTPSQLLEYLYSRVGPHYYDRIDLHFAEGERRGMIECIKGKLPESIEGVKVVKTETSDGFRFILADDSWLLIRFSGTEPILRIYTESDSKARVARLLEFGKALTDT